MVGLCTKNSLRRAGIGNTAVAPPVVVAALLECSQQLFLTSFTILLGSRHMLGKL